MERISVILVDDHPVVRAGIKSLIGSSTNIEIVAEASDGEEALKLIEKLRPNVVVTDISMPNLTGLELVEIVSSKFPETKVIILTMHVDEEYIIKCFDSGVMSFLPKDSEQFELLEAIEEVHDGRKYLNTMVSRVLAQRMIKGKSLNEPRDNLTNRETEILKLLVDGKRNKEIAEDLFISVRTVDTHRTHIMRKLKVNNTAELVKKAINNKLI